MKKILFVLTGGTIGSFSDDTGHNAPDAEKAVPILMKGLRESDSPYREQEFEVTCPLITLSENMSVDKWNMLIASLRNVDFTSYKGVIIAHGSDTLHLTMPLMAEVLKGCPVPVGFVVSHRSLEDKTANGIANFISVVEYINYCRSGVFTIYRNMDGILYIHKAEEILRCGDFSDDFYSKGMKVYSREDYVNRVGVETVEASGDSKVEAADVSEDSKVEAEDVSENSKVEAADVSEDSKVEAEDSEMAEMPIRNMLPLSDSVLVIDPYVGINYDNYDISRVRHVLHLTYHSGTADSEKLPAFIERCAEAGVDVYLAPVSENYKYSTTYKLIQTGAKPMFNMTVGAAYARLLVEDAR